MTGVAKHDSKRQERPTLKTVARASGLAVTTVSRALGDAPDISEDTKKRVKRIAEEVGYVPNRAGVRLRTGRTNVIALVLPTESEVMNVTPLLIASIAGALDGTPYHLIVVPELPNQDPLDPVRYVVETRSADAIILNRIAPEDRRVAYLREKQFPFVTHGRTVWRDAHAYFDYDNYAFGRYAVETLASRGRRSFILIAPPQDQAYGRDMLRGAKEAAAEHGVDLQVTDCTSDDSREDVAASIDDCLDRNEDVDALISASPHAALVAVKILERRGRVIGVTFDVLAKETVPILEMLHDDILITSEDISRAGSFLALAAIDEIRRTTDRPMQAIDHPSGETWTSRDIIEVTGR